MESESVVFVGEASAVVEGSRDAESRALIGVRRWLEDAWRHGEVIVDNDGLEVTEPAQQPNRFETSRRTVGAPELGVM